MRLYEVVYILDPALEEAAVTAKLENFHALVTSQGGEVVAVDHWGSRQLAYPIKKKEMGYYVVAQFETDSKLLPEFERVIKLEETVLRHLIVINEGLPPTPVAAGEGERTDEGSDKEPAGEKSSDKEPAGEKGSDKEPAGEKSGDKEPAGAGGEA